MNEYRRTNTTVSLLNYHFVFCPRYRRKIFLQAEVEQRFKELVHEVCEELQIQIVALECDKDHTYMFLNALPSLSPANMMAKIKGVTSKKCVKNFRIFGTWQVCGHAHTSFLLQEMYQVK